MGIDATFWVAISFLVAAWLVTKELKRKEKEGLLNPIIGKKIIGKGLSITEIFIILLLFI